MSELFPEVHRATIRVLSENGYDVVIPKGQGCCGALHAHAGDMESARKLMAKNVRAFGGSEFDALVVNSAGCGTAMREAEQWLSDSATEMASRVRDVAEFLDEVGLRLPSVDREFHSLRVCYDDPCHLIHSQGVAAQPRRLLRELPGVELVDHADASQCCGAAGIYNLSHAKMSAEILDSKMQALSRANPDVIATGNPGCLLQIRRGVAERGLDCEVLHPIELIERAYPERE